MITNDEIQKILSVREEGIVTLESGIEIIYPSRESYYLHQPASPHKIEWHLDKSEIKGKSRYLLKAERAERDTIAATIAHRKNVINELKQLQQKTIDTPLSNSERWVSAITGDRNAWKMREDVDAIETFDYDKVLYLKTQSETLIAEAEKVRGIHMSHRIITLDGVTKTVLYRNAIDAKPTLTPDELQTISDYEYLALWHTSAAAACKIANSFVHPQMTDAFLKELNKLIDTDPETTLTFECGKDTYLRKMKSLFSLLVAFHPNESIGTLSKRFEAERDFLAIENPSEIVATYHKNGSDNNELVYEIEIPNTKLSSEQKKFFIAAADPTVNDDTIGEVYNFYKHLKSWQKKLIRREAKNILEENRLRPSQMQFLPMAPNFWTRYTAVKPNQSSKKATIVSEINRCGALSPRTKADDAGIIQFQEMQYSQVRANFGLEEGDKLCYTSYKQNFYGHGADDNALENITKAHENDNNPEFAEDNHIYNIPMGRFSGVSRIMNAAHNFFFENKFENNNGDPLIKDAFHAVDIFIRRDNPHRTHLDRENPLTIDEFLKANIQLPVNTTLTDELKTLITEIKLDLEQVYRYAIEIEQLRYGSFLTHNLRIASLRSALFDELTRVKTKIAKLPGDFYTRNKIGSVSVTYKAYVSGCKSNIDRGTLFALTTEVLALKEHRRRQYWNTTFTKPTNTPSWLNTKSWAVSILLNIPIVRTIASFFTKYFSGDTLKELNEKYAVAIMEREVASIDAAIAKAPNGKLSFETAQAPLLKKRADLINAAINANVSIEAAVCRGGHSRIMPSHGGSTNVSGIKDDVVAAVTPNLEEHNEHLISQNGLSSHNHGLAGKSGFHPRVKPEHKQAYERAKAEIAATNGYQPPMVNKSILKDKHPTSNNVNDNVPSKDKILSFSELPFADYHNSENSINNSPTFNNGKKKQSIIT